jgi:hypothetical protein
MIVHAELSLRGHTLESVISNLHEFCRLSPGWKTDVKRNAYHSKLTGESCFWVLPPDGTIRVRIGIALVGDEKSKLVLSNIVPLRDGSIEIEEYNQVAQAFVSRLRALLRAKSLRGIRVDFSDGKIGIEDIISSPTCRRLFEQFLGVHPFNFHPLDVRRLDEFIVAVSRWGRKVDSSRICRFLSEEKGWKSKDAEWVRNRLDTGIEILRVRGSFRRTSFKRGSARLNNAQHARQSHHAPFVDA